MENKDLIEQIIAFSFQEDLGSGDHSSLSSVPDTAMGRAKVMMKDEGVLAGVELAKQVLHFHDASLKIIPNLKDGTKVKYGDIAFEIEGKSQSILATERIMLNFMQRMSAIATETRKVVESIAGTNAKLLDTRKTTPGIRALEKWAVRIGGGHNHRMGLYDMIMIKDNHIDYAGSIRAAIENAQSYIKKNQLSIPIEIETRNRKEVEEVLEVGGVDRIMLDNFTPEEIREVLPLIPSTVETEASGGITRENIRGYAETGIDFISSGALTHSVKSLDISLKATFNT